MGLDAIFSGFNKIEIKISILKICSIFFGLLTLLLFSMASMVITGIQSGYSFLIIIDFDIFFKETNEIIFTANPGIKDVVLMDQIIDFSHTRLLFIGYLFSLGLISDIFYLKCKCEKKNPISKNDLFDTLRITGLVLCSMGLLLYYFGIYIYAFLFQNEISTYGSYSNINIIIRPHFGLVFGVLTVFMIFLEGIINKDILLYKKAGSHEGEGLIEYDAKDFELV
jgi:hypothetical protein